MAEASCSGSTPFKRLIDHHSTSTNPQDRLVDRTTNSHASFRSAPALQDHSQNSFGAFVNAPPALPSFPHDPATRLASHAHNLQPLHHHHHHHHQHHQQHQQHPLHAPGVPLAAPESSSSSSSSWAADFSRFSAAQAQRPHVQLQHGQTSAHTPFASQYGPQSTSQYGTQSAYAQPRSFAPGYDMAGAGVFSAAMPQQQVQPQPGQSEFDAEMARWMNAHGGGNMADVDAVMDEMARELELEESESKRAQTDLRSADAELANLSLEVNDWKESAQDLTSEQTELNTETDLTETETETEIPGEKDGEHVMSGVAEAAEKLLDCVKHEGGEKWQKSVFLSLMRDFRDGRKDIVGDEIRTNGGSPQAGLQEIST